MRAIIVTVVLKLIYISRRELGRKTGPSWTRFSQDLKVSNSELRGPIIPDCGCKVAEGSFAKFSGKSQGQELTSLTSAQFLIHDYKSPTPILTIFAQVLSCFQKSNNDKENVNICVYQTDTVRNVTFVEPCDRLIVQSLTLWIMQYSNNARITGAEGAHILTFSLSLLLFWKQLSTCAKIVKIGVGDL